MAFDMYGDVVLTRDVPEHGVRAGDIGTVVECHIAPGISEEGYSVEFFDMAGNTVALATLPAPFASQRRRIGQRFGNSLPEAEAHSRRPPQPFHRAQPPLELVATRTSWDANTHPRQVNDLRTPNGTTRKRESNRVGGAHAPRAGRLRIGYSGAMNANVSIEVDKHTADVLQTRAAELGVTVSQLIAELAALDGTPREAEADEVAELDRRSARAAEGSRVAHDRVVQWLRTWGTSGFRPWPGP